MITQQGMPHHLTLWCCAVFTSRGCVKKTWLEKGLPYISTLALENAHNLPAMLKWNHDNGIHLFRYNTTCAHQRLACRAPLLLSHSSAVLQTRLHVLCTWYQICIAPPGLCITAWLWQHCSLGVCLSLISRLVS